jgi:acyl carrier protein
MRAVPVAPEAVDLFAPTEASTLHDPGHRCAACRMPHAQSSRLPATPADVHQTILGIVAASSGYEDADELDLDYELEADLGIDTVKQAEIFSEIRDTFQIPARDGGSDAADADLGSLKTLRALIGWAASRMGAAAYTAPSPASVPSAAPVATPTVLVVPPQVGPAAVPALAPIIGADAVARFLEAAAEAGLSGAAPEAFAHALLPAVQHLLSAAWEASQMKLAPFTRTLPEVVCTGASVGLPGGAEVFGPDNFVAMLRGDNRISHIRERVSKFLEKGLVRLVKDPATGQGSFLPVADESQVLRLAGIEAKFDVRDWGLDESFARSLDVTTALGLAAAPRSPARRRNPARADVQDDGDGQAGSRAPGMLPVAAAATAPA